MLNQFIVLGSIKQKFDNQILLQTNEHGNLRLTGKDVFDDLIDGNVYGFKGHIETDKDGIQLVVEKTTSIDSDDMEKFRDLSSTILVGKRVEASGNTWTLELMNEEQQPSRVNVFGKEEFMDEINKQINVVEIQTRYLDKVKGYTGDQLKEYIEKIAKNEMGYVSEGERIFYNVSGE